MANISRLAAREAAITAKLNAVEKGTSELQEFAALLNSEVERHDYIMQTLPVSASPGSQIAEQYVSASQASRHMLVAAQLLTQSLHK
jgi:hypothetical protein